MFLTDLGSLVLSYRTKGMKQSCGCGSAFPCECESPTSVPGSGEIALRKDLQEVLFPQAGKWSLQDAGKASLLRGRRGNHPACVC